MSKQVGKWKKIKDPTTARPIYPTVLVNHLFGRIERNAGTLLSCASGSSRSVDVVLGALRTPGPPKLVAAALVLDQLSKKTSWHVYADLNEFAAKAATSLLISFPRRASWLSKKASQHMFSQWIDHSAAG